MTGNLKGALATAQLTSDNELLKMTANAEYNLAHSYPDGKVTVDVTQLDLHELGLIPKPMKRPLAFNLSGEARQNRVFTHFTSGDMKLNLSARAGVYPLIRQSTRFVDVLMKQIDESYWIMLLCVRHCRPPFSLSRQGRRIRWHIIWQ